MDQQIREGKPIVHESSTFKGYVVDMENIEDVGKAYEFVKFLNLNARHIVCAYRLPGPNIIELQDYVDDDEHEAGKMLLDYMMKAQINNRAIFVVRHYDGVHIGPKRFEYIMEAAKHAINEKPFNRVTGEYQFS